MATLHSATSMEEGKAVPFPTRRAPTHPSPRGLGQARRAQVGPPRVLTSWQAPGLRLRGGCQAGAVARRPAASRAQTRGTRTSRCAGGRAGGWDARPDVARETQASIRAGSSSGLASGNPVGAGDRASPALPAHLGRGHTPGALVPMAVGAGQEAGTLWQEGRISRAVQSRSLSALPCFLSLSAPQGPPGAPAVQPGS